MVTQECMYLTTVEAARYVGLSHRTLKRYRVTGEGPVFHRFGGRVRYRRDDLDVWAAERRRVSTADDGSGERPAPARRGAAVALLTAAALASGIDPAWATTDTTFGTRLDTVEDIVGGTGGQLAAALAVGAALIGSVLRFNAMQLMGAVGVGIAAGAGIPTETLQMFLARNAGVAEGRLTKKGAREMRAAFAKTILVVDEGSLASTVQARDLLRIAAELRMPRVVLVGDAKQLDAGHAGKPFAQIQAAGMQTAAMDEIMRQRDPVLKEAVLASLKGDIERAFEKLGSNVAEVKPDNIAGTVAARWLRLDAEARANTGVMAPSHELRHAINGHIRERLAREGRIHGPAMEAERLVSMGYTNAEKALAANYGAGNVVAFHRPYRRIGVEKGDERRVMGVDHRAGTVLLDDGKGGEVAWKPEEIGGRRGGSEVYRAEEIELRAGDRIRWTRNDAGLGLVNSRTAEVLKIANGRVTFRLEDGKTLELGKGDPQLRHLDHAWASTVHAFQGRTVDNVIAAMEARHPHLTTQKSFYVEISRARDRAEPVTDDTAELRTRLQAVTGERIAALEGIGEMKREAPDRADEAARDRSMRPERDTGEGAGKAREGMKTPARTPEPPVRDHSKGGMDTLGCEGNGTRKDAPESRAAADRPEDARRNRTIRFSDSEWEEVRRAALLHETPPAEFVRETILALARTPEGAVSDAQASSLAPLIERMFRYTWFLATEKRDAMVREGRKDEVDALVAEGRALHDKLRRCPDQA